MSKFTKMIIEENNLKVFSINDNNEEQCEFEVDMSDFYWIEDKDLEHNVFSTEDDWLLGEDLDDEEAEISDEINEEFMENFCCDVPEIVTEKLNEKGIEVEIPADCEDPEYYINEVFQDAIKEALNLDENWNRK